MLEAIRLIAERKISEAIQQGQLNIESWRNRPLPMTSDHMIPEELRMAYKVLKNAGYLPPEIETKKEIQQLEDLLSACEDEQIRVKQIKKLNYLMLKLNTMKGDTVSLESQEEYYRKIVERISVNKPTTKK
jgi:DnaJ homologue, subfamily C, member 28, conserved domain